MKTMDIERLGNKNTGQGRVKFKNANETLLGLGRAVGTTNRESLNGNADTKVSKGVVG